MRLRILLLLLLSVFVVNSRAFNVGVGKYDITGPIQGVGFMGYAMPDQTGRGLLSRQWARAFVVQDSTTGAKTAFVSIGACFPATSVKRQVIKLLNSDEWTLANVMISGEHTHAGPAGFNQHPLYGITSLGFQKKNFKVISEGIAQAITIADSNIVKNCRVYINSGDLVGSNINRSPYSYTFNPASERAKYKHDTDTLMTTLKFESAAGALIGSLSWFAVHGTSLFNNNHLVSQDNKGYAAYLWEKSAAPGFVVAFGQSNEGDVSPNTRGPFCLDTGLSCQYQHSTCNGRNEMCQGQGPHGLDDYKNCQTIGENQYKFGKALFDSATTLLSGGTVQYISTYVDMSNVTVSPKFTISGKVEHTCSAALGDSMAAGTTDGPGAFSFKQGTNSTKGNKFFNWIASFLAKPPASVKACQHPKPILLWTQGVTFPTQWTQSILPLQLFRWGQLVIIAVPGEFTTMSGRRLRDTVKQAYVDNGAYHEGMNFVIAGLSNTYSHYIATRQEYGEQRYEAASTLFGPATLEAYQQEFYNLATMMIKGQKAPELPVPPDISNKTFDFLPPVIVDGHPIGKPFGTVEVQPEPIYARGATVNTTFWGTDPRSNYLTGSSFLYIQQLNGETGKWFNVYNDNDYVTRYHWSRHGIDQSKIIVQWDTSADDVPGTYRVFTQSYSKQLLSKKLKYYNGTSKSFKLT